MKGDCGGAAGLLFAFKNMVENGFNQNLYCLLCLAENAVGPKSYRPDDIINMYWKNLKIVSRMCRSIMGLKKQQIYENILPLYFYDTFKNF